MRQRQEKGRNRRPHRTAERPHTGSVWGPRGRRLCQGRQAGTRAASPELPPVTLEGHGQDRARSFSGQDRLRHWDPRSVPCAVQDPGIADRDTRQCGRVVLLTRLALVCDEKPTQSVRTASATAARPMAAGDPAPCALPSAAPPGTGAACRARGADRHARREAGPPRARGRPSGASPWPQGHPTGLSELRHRWRSPQRPGKCARSQGLTEDGQRAASADTGRGWGSRPSPSPELQFLPDVRNRSQI